MAPEAQRAAHVKTRVIARLLRLFGCSTRPTHAYPRPAKSFTRDATKLASHSVRVRLQGSGALARSRVGPHL